jgi:hypothetical protein
MLTGIVILLPSASGTFISSSSSTGKTADARFSWVTGEIKLRILTDFGILLAQPAKECGNAL